MAPPKAPFIAAFYLDVSAGWAAGQSPVGIAFRAGTLGFGGEVALSVSEEVTLRGGAGLSTLDATTRLEDIPVQLDLPNAWYDVGVDWFATNSFRLGTGILFQPTNPVIEGLVVQPVELGGQPVTPDELGMLTGVVRTRNRIPYLRAGFGRHTSPGFGFFLDAGVGLLGSPTIDLEASGGSMDATTLRALLDSEATAIEANLKTYLRFWPILSVGVRYGIGG